MKYISYLLGPRLHAAGVGLVSVNKNLVLLRYRGQTVARYTPKETPFTQVLADAEGAVNNRAGIKQ